MKPLVIAFLVALLMHSAVADPTTFAVQAPATPSPSAPAPGAAPRQLLEAISPIAGAALRELEARRGAAYSDAALETVLHSEEFEQAYERQRLANCAIASHRETHACLPDPDERVQLRRRVPLI